MIPWTEIQVILRASKLPKDVYLFAQGSKAVFFNPPDEYFWYLAKNLDDRYAFAYRITSLLASMLSHDTLRSIVLKHTEDCALDFMLQCSTHEAYIVDLDGGEMP